MIWLNQAGLRIAPLRQGKVWRSNFNEQHHHSTTLRKEFRAILWQQFL